MTNAPASEFENLHEFIKQAHVNLNRNIWDYLVGGAETETTVRRNRLALDQLALQPRVLVNVARVACGWDFFGKPIRLPIALAPVGSCENFTRGGAAAAAEGAGAFGVPVFASSVSQPSLEEVARAATGPKVFQLYVRGDDGFIDDHVRRAVDCGYDAFCLTVDTALYSRRERDIAKRFRKNWRPADELPQRYQAALHWGDVGRFKAKHAIPLIIKGIATAEDAVRAVEHGVDVVYVSNHGGRQLDHGRGTAEVLPDVVAAVAGRARVYVDGGFSRGTDIIKGIALGADLVLVGRLYLYGLAAAGVPGLVRLLEVLEHEIYQSLGLLGVGSFRDLDRSHLHAAAAVTPPHVHSAFPLLNLDSPY